MENNNHRSAVVVDIGTARTKVTLASYDCKDVVSFQSHSFDHSLSAAWKEGGAEGLSACLKRISEDTRSLMGGASGADLCWIGAHVFRDEEFCDLLVNLANQLFGEVNVLSANTEASLFYQSIENELAVLQSPVVIDVGGGSIQMAWGSRISESLSAPLGTYSLQDRFQIDLERSIAANSAEWQLAYDAVFEAFSMPVGQLAQAEALVVGSNVMSDFFGSAFAKAGIPSSPSGAYNRNDVRFLCEKIGGVPYGDLAEYFRQAPGFMYGADKLLLSIAAIMDCLSVDEVIGTNLSISKGLALLMLRSPEHVERSGLKVVKLDEAF